MRPLDPFNLLPSVGLGDLQGTTTSSYANCACETYGAPPDLDTFCVYYELQHQPKKAKVDGVEVEYRFASCAFMVKRVQKEGGLEISFTQKNKWDKDWPQY